MFGRFKKINPDEVLFKMENGEPCFYAYRAFSRKPHNGGKETYSEKEIDAISRELFDIEQFNKRRPEAKGMWQLVEETTLSGGHCWVIKFFPFKGEAKPEEHCERLSAVLMHMHR